MPADAQLAHRPGVELVNTGSWQLLSGSWSPNRKDILAAVEAARCPAVRRPRLKLGHLDPRFNAPDESEFDGTPSLGWFDNLRASDDGNTLIGDQVALPWLSQVQAAAYPDRSVEGTRNARCALGHVHPFVVTAVSLLGETPPGIPTLKSITSIDDLPAALGVAASGEVTEGGEAVHATVRASTEHPFDEEKHLRDGHGKFAHEAGAAVNAAKDAAHGRPTGLKRDEKLAGRIPLAHGETYAGSATIRGAGIAAARVDSPDGPHLRIGFGINDEDLNRWSGADKGATAVLDQHGMDQLRAAIPAMQNAGKDGKAQWKTLDKHADKLDAAERDIVNRQYPNLNGAGKKELAGIDRQAGETQSRLDSLDARQQDRIARMSGGGQELAALDRQISDAVTFGDTAKVADLRSKQDAILTANPTEHGISEALFRRDGAEQDKLRQQMADLVSRRAELTKVSVPLSPAEQAELDRIRAEITAHNDEMTDFGDGAVLASGSIPGGWGSVDWQVAMSYDTPRYDIKVTPKAGPGTNPPEPLEPGDLRKLAALLDKAGATMPDVKAAAPAPDGDGDDDDEPTGAMVALIPAAEDAVRLAVDGGEPAEQLHLTLAYLGDASTLDASDRQDLIDTVSSVVNGMPQIEAQAGSVAVLNPSDDTDQDACQVYLLTSDLLADVQDALDDALGDPDFAPEPWLAHVTARYSGDLPGLSDLVANLGPITFDRVRIAIAGQVIDIPLIDDGDSPDSSEFDDSLEVPNILMPVAAASADTLREYWLHGKGALKIRWGEKNDFYRCVAQLRKYVADPKGLCNTYHREALGVAPGQESVHAAQREEAVMAAAVSDKPWNPKAGDYTPPQWKTACLIDSGQGDPNAKGRYSLPVREPDGTLNRAAVHAAASSLKQVKADPAAAKAAAGKLVSLYGQLGEDPPPSVRFAASKKVAASAPDLPAAEPEQPITEPKEDLVSDLSAFRSRLGLDDTADEQAMLAAVDELKAKADTPATPTDEMVAASAAATKKAEDAEAEKDELRKEVQILASQVNTMSSRIAEAETEKAATVKASVIQAAADQGKFTPAEREQWENDYDEAPAAITRILASIAPGYKVPVKASGTVGAPEPDFDDDFEALIARIDAPTGKVA